MTHTDWEPCSPPTSEKKNPPGPVPRASGRDGVRRMPPSSGGDPTYPRLEGHAMNRLARLTGSPLAALALAVAGLAVPGGPASRAGEPKPRAALAGHDGWVHAVAFSPD